LLAILEATKMLALQSKKGKDWKEGRGEKGESKPIRFTMRGTGASVQNEPPGTRNRVYEKIRFVLP
jgi:hypothetical protein